jgi:hypothetical protein
MNSLILAAIMASADVDLTADPASAFWQPAPAIVIQTDYTGAPVANHRTEVRARWTAGHLYLLFTCQYQALNLKPRPIHDRRNSALVELGCG